MPEDISSEPAPPVSVALSPAAEPETQTDETAAITETKPVKKPVAKKTAAKKTVSKKPVSKKPASKNTVTKKASTTPPKDDA
ncbi:MAG: hypothetical protein NWR87_05115 [Rhodospirillales bacterium]|nr:hypothetical protein [Rhodospirillales bacterium]